MKNKKRAFTLTELLVVVIVLGTLAAVAVPKFSRVLETRRTGEAEEMLSAVRMEQEKRCSLGQNYTGDLGNIPTVAYAKTSASQGKTNNYTYTLTSTGIEASRSGKDYVIKIPSYKTGQMCCEGSGCDALNKSYPSCASLSLPASDECAASDVVQPTDPCDTDPNSCACSSYAAGHRCECDADYASLNACECNPSTAACCGEGEEWNPQTGACEPTDECIENYGEAVKVSAGSDTCDGDGTSKYTCDGHFNGTCTDVYTANATSMSFSSVTQDPFLMFKNNYWLAGNTGLCGNGEYCGMNGSMTVCCPEGYYCDWDDYVLTPGSNPNETRTGTCKVGQRPDTPEEVDICAEDEVWDASLGECVKISEGEGSEEFEPVVWTYKREVTCCGDGQAVVDDCESNPNQEKCCKFPNMWCVDECVSALEYNRTEKCCLPPHVWNGQVCVIEYDPCSINPNSCSCSVYAKANRCECSPSTVNCCTTTQVRGGMVYNSATKTCACPSGTTWNSSTSKCEEKGPYTCFTSYHSQTIANPNYSSSINTGDKTGEGWRTVGATTSMTCGGSSFTGTYSYSKGQEANCEPGKEYLYYMTWGHKAGPYKGYDKYYYTCLRCSNVPSLSQCGNFTVPAPTNTGGSSGSEVIQPETGVVGFN